MKKQYFLLFLLISALIFSCKPKNGFQIYEPVPTFFPNAQKSSAYFINHYHLKRSKSDKSMFYGDSIPKKKKIKAIYTDFYEITFGKIIDSKLSFSTVELFNKRGQIIRKYMSIHLKDTTIRKKNPERSSSKGDISFSDMLTENQIGNIYKSIRTYQKNMHTAYYYDKQNRLEYIVDQTKPSIYLKDRLNYAYNVLFFDYKNEDIGKVNLAIYQYKYPFKRFILPVDYDFRNNIISEDIGIEIYPKPFISNKLLNKINKTEASYFHQNITYF